MTERGSVKNYEVWETSTGNLLGAYSTKRDALALVREVIDLHGLDSVETIVLGLHDGQRQAKTIAEGKNLAELAFSTAGSARPRAS